MSRVVIRTVDQLVAALREHGGRVCNPHADGSSGYSHFPADLGPWVAVRSDVLHRASLAGIVRATGNPWRPDYVLVEAKKDKP